MSKHSSIPAAFLSFSWSCGAGHLFDLPAGQQSCNTGQYWRAKPPSSPASLTTRLIKEETVKALSLPSTLSRSNSCGCGKEDTEICARVWVDGHMHWCVFTFLYSALCLLSSPLSLRKASVLGWFWNLRCQCSAPVEEEDSVRRGGERWRWGRWAWKCVWPSCNEIRVHLPSQTCN